MSRGDWNRVDVAFLIEPARIVYLQGNQNNILLWESPKTAQKVFLNTARCCGLNFFLAQFGTQEILGKTQPIFFIFGFNTVFNTRYSSRCACNKSADPGPVMTLHFFTLRHWVTLLQENTIVSHLSLFKACSDQLMYTWCNIIT